MHRRLHSLVICLLLCATLACAQEKEKWLQIQSPNFIVYTNGGDKRGRDVALRFEQMRKIFGTLILRDKVNINVPLAIIAFKDSKGLKSVSPLWKGKPVELAGLYQQGEDKHFIALDLSSPESFNVVFHEYAHLLLNANFPKTDLWFDEGFAEYYSTIDITEKEIWIGRAPKYAGDILDNGLMPVEQLFSIRHDSREYNENGPKRQTLYSQAWLAVHYLYDSKKLKEAGDYFDLVINKRLPMPEALKQTFGMTPKEFDKTLRDYFQRNRIQIYRLNPPQLEPALYVPTKLKDYQALMQIADFHLHSGASVASGNADNSSYLELAAREFRQVLEADPGYADAHRGLGYYYLRKGDIENAGQNFRRAAALESKDARVYFYLAQFIFKNVAGSTRDMTDLQEMNGLLDKSIELDPLFAESYNLKSFVLSAAHNYAGAIQSLRQAIKLSPRNDMYRANLATQYMLDGKYDEAMGIWGYLKNSTEPAVAEVASKQLEFAKTYKEKPLLRLQGEAMETTAPQWRKKEGKLDPEVQALEDKQTGASEQNEDSHPPQTGPDTRTIKFLKGTLSKVDCANDGSAVLTVVSPRGTLLLHTKNADKLLIIGDMKFACNWKNQKVAVNYKTRDTKSGDIVSLEVQ